MRKINGIKSWIFDRLIKFINFQYIGKGKGQDV